MPRLLENLEPGTPVRCNDGDVPVGDVRGVFTTGESRVPEYLCVHWSDRGEETLVPTDDVLSIEDGGVVLRGSRASYADLVRFEPENNALVHPLK